MTGRRWPCTISALRIVRNGEGEVGYEVLAGGGQGRTPMIGKTIQRFPAEPHLLSYLEAILRVYNEFGRRDNMFKARIKILVHEIGIDEPSAAASKRNGSRSGRHRGARSAGGRGAAHCLVALRRRVRAALRWPARARAGRSRTDALRPPGLGNLHRQSQAARPRHRDPLAEARAAGRRATRPPTRWTPSPTSPTATRSTRCG